MKFPAFWAKANRILAVISGVLIFIISLMSALEVVMRNVIHRPTVWTADLSYYLLIWAIFLGAGYAFQEHGHVRVDLILNALPEKVRKPVSALAYAVSLFFCVVLTVYSWKFLVKCYTTARLTYAMVPILQWKLVIGMVIGCILMILTLIFIILDILAGGKKYL